MADDIIVEHEDNGAHGRYFVRFGDGSEGEMTYRRIAPGIIATDHTGVPRQHRGTGVALKLVEAGIADARRTGTKIVPLCSYVEAQFRRHPEWEDLRAT